MLNKDHKRERETKMKVSYHILPNSIALSFEGKMFTLQKDDSRYSKVVDAIKAGDMESIPSLVDVSKLLEGSPFELVEGAVVVPGEGVLPEALSRRIIALRNEGLPIEPLVKFWGKLKQNPSYNSRLMLYKFLEHNGHPLTEDGNFIAYRGVSEDFKDKHTGKFDNSVGSVCEISRDQVDDNPNNTCSSGLHVACFDYARGFGERLVEVEVDPADVVAVPTDYNGTKMRVCKFVVVAVCEEMRTEALYGIKAADDMPTFEFEEHSDNQETIEMLKEERDLVESSIEEFNPMHDCIEDLIKMRDRLNDLNLKIEAMESKVAS
jgi:hypothetical protein